MRMFVCIDIPRDVKNEMDAITKKLMETRADLKPVKPDNLHITLKFLGEVREDDVNKVIGKLTEISNKTSSFNIDFSKLGYFGSVRFPRTIWLGISKGRDDVVSLSKDMNKELEFIRKEDHKPSPHVTLARVRSYSHSEDLVNMIVKLRDVKLREINVNKILLKTSILKPDGPEYSDYRSFELNSG